MMCVLIYQITITNFIFHKLKDSCIISLVFHSYSCIMWLAILDFIHWPVTTVYVLMFSLKTLCTFSSPFFSKWLEGKNCLFNISMHVILCIKAILWCCISLCTLYWRNSEHKRDSWSCVIMVVYYGKIGHSYTIHSNV